MNFARGCVEQCGLQSENSRPCEFVRIYPGSEFGEVCESLGERLGTAPHATRGGKQNIAAPLSVATEFNEVNKRKTR